MAIAPPRRVAPTPLPSPPPQPAPASILDEMGSWIERNARDLLGVLAVLLLVAVANLATAVALEYPPLVVLEDSLFFLVPTLAAALIVGGLPFRLPPAVRVALALVTAGFLILTFALAHVFPRSFYVPKEFVVYYFTIYFPVVFALVVPGPGRWRWRASQIVGVGLLLVPLWRGLYYSLPDLNAVFTPGDVQPAIPAIQLYRSFGLKSLRDVFYPLAGLYLLLYRFPWAQKLPLWREDWRAVLSSIDARLRRGLWRDLGWSALLFILVAYGAVQLQIFLSRFRVLQTGDDSQVFVEITPDLVFLLALAAGVGEEIVYRGLLQPYLTRVFHDFGAFAWPLAVFVQALFFALVHAGYGNLIHVLLPLAFGLAMGLVFRSFGLLACIVIHTQIDIFAFGDSACGQHPWIWVPLNVLLYLNFVAAFTIVVWEIVVWWWKRRRKRDAEALAA